MNHPAAEQKKQVFDIFRPESLAKSKKCFIFAPALSASGGIGRHARLRIWCRKACGFESRLAYIENGLARDEQVRLYFVRSGFDFEFVERPVIESCVALMFLERAGKIVGARKVGLGTHI